MPRAHPGRPGPGGVRIPARIPARRPTRSPTLLLPLAPGGRRYRLGVPGCHSRTSRGGGARGISAALRAAAAPGPCWKGAWGCPETAGRGSEGLLPSTSPHALRAPRRAGSLGRRSSPGWRRVGGSAWAEGFGAPGTPPAAGSPPARFLGPRGALAEVLPRGAKVRTLASGLGLFFPLWFCLTVNGWEFGSQNLLRLGQLLGFLSGEKNLFFSPSPPFAFFVRSVCLVLFVLD